MTTPHDPADEDRTTEPVPAEPPAQPAPRPGPRPPIIMGPRRPPATPPATVPAVRVDYFDDRIPGVNTMAIAALVFAVLFAPAGIVMGHVAKRQIRRTGESGSAIATVALFIGYSIMLCACCGPVALLLLGVWG